MIVHPLRTQKTTIIQNENVINFNKSENQRCGLRSYYVEITNNIKVDNELQSIYIARIQMVIALHPSTTKPADEYNNKLEIEWKIL